MTSFANGAFWRFTLGFAAMTVADALVTLTLPFAVLGVHAGSHALGVVVLAASIPNFLAPALGTLVDRASPRVTLTLGALLKGAVWLTCGLLGHAGHLSLNVLWLAAFMNAAAFALIFAGQAALVPRLVPRSALPRANVVISMILLGAPIVVFTVGTRYTFGVNALAWATPAYLLLALITLRLPFTAPSSSVTHEGPAALLHGARFARRHPHVLALIAYSGAANVLLGALSVRVPLLMQIDGSGASGYAQYQWLLSAASIVGVLLAGALTRRVTLDQLLFGTRVLLLGVPAALLVTSHAAHVGAGATLGLALGLLEVAGLAQLQRLLPHDLRGRVFGLLLGLNATGGSLGAGLAGTTLPNAVILTVAGAVVLASSLLWWTARGTPRDLQDSTPTV